MSPWMLCVLGNLCERSFCMDVVTLDLGIHCSEPSMVTWRINCEQRLLRLVNRWRLNPVVLPWTRQPLEFGGNA